MPSPISSRFAHFPYPSLTPHTLFDIFDVEGDSIVQPLIVQGGQRKG